MHSRRRRSSLGLLALGALIAVAVVVLRKADSPALAPTDIPSASWLGLVGDDHPQVDLGGRVIVVLRVPSVAQHLERTKGATESEERRWAAEAFAAQQEVLTGLARHGFTVRPDYSFVRVIDGFSAELDASAIELLEQDDAVAGVFRVRAAFPAAVSAEPAGRDGTGAGTGASIPGLDGRGITVALLDTGVDRAHPYLGGRVESGIDIVGASGSAAAQANPGNPLQVEQHGTQMAGLMVGSDGPRGMHGVAPGATLLPIRVAGWQPAAGGALAVYARSDQLIAGLDRAADPNGDGDTHDAARVALLGVVEPFAGFSDCPEEQAVDGATSLGVLVVVPAGNAGPAGPLYGSISGPGGARTALVVGAIDTRRTLTTVRVSIRRDLVVDYHGNLPLLSDPSNLPSAIDVPVTTLDRPGSVEGKAVIVPGGADPVGAVRDAVASGAGAVLVFGAQPPAGALGVVPVPVVGLTRAVAQRLRGEIGRGFPVALALGRVSSTANREIGHLASFSASGLTFDGALAPQLSAPGVALPTADTSSGAHGYTNVTGTSAAAAEVAGVAVLLAQARPGMSPEEIASLLVGGARRAAYPLIRGGAGVIDGGQSAAIEVTASPATLAFGPWRGPKWRARRIVTVRNVSTRRIAVGLRSSSALVTIEPTRIVLRRGESAQVAVTAHAPARADRAVIAGSLIVTPRASVKIRLPWVLAGPVLTDLIGAADISPTAFTPSDTHPAVLRVSVGSISGDGSSPQIQPVSRLDVLLYRSDGAFVGVLARPLELLPGIYRFAVNGRGPDGAVLAPGGYEIRLVAWPSAPGAPSRDRVRFDVRSSTG